MNNNIKIRKTASIMMCELCDVCDTNLQFKDVNILELLKDDAERQLIIKAGKYLVDKQCIKSTKLPCDNWEGSITAQGIDWVEDYLETH